MNAPIRYFGGKGRELSTHIINHFPTEEFTTYVEPFGGSGAVLFKMKPVPIEIYNDLESNVYSLFKTLSTPELFKEFKEKCDLTFYADEIRKEFKEQLKGELSIVDRAHKFFIVNRTSFNGIGGFSANIVIRRKMAKSVSDMLSAIDRLEEVHQRLSKVLVFNDDGVKLIKKYDRPNTLMYLDPPYHHSTRTDARYVVDMNDDQQKELIDTLLNLKDAKIILSGYDCEEYQRLVDGGWKKIDRTINTVSGTLKAKTKTEVLWMNF
jgi:DNA adenine methylase